MKLGILFRIFAVLHVIVGLMMLFGGSTLSEMSGWEHSVGIATQAEHHGAALICLCLLFWMLPRWLSAEQLKAATPVAIIIQIILLIMPIYHAAVGAIPVDGSLYFILAVSIILIILFFIAYRKPVDES